VTLKPGESRKVTFYLGFDDLSFVNQQGKDVVEPTDYTVWIGGSSLATKSANFKITR